MMLPAILSIVIGAALVVFRKKAARDIQTTFMYRISPGKASVRAYERLYLLGGTVMFLIGVAFMVNEFLS